MVCERQLRRKIRTYFPENYFTEIDRLAAELAAVNTTKGLASLSLFRIFPLSHYG